MTNRHTAPLLLLSCHPGGIGIVGCGRENVANLPPRAALTLVSFLRSYCCQETSKFGVPGSQPALQVIIATEELSLHMIPRPCWGKAIPGERSLEQSLFESTASSRNLFKDRTIHLTMRSLVLEDHIGTLGDLSESFGAAAWLKSIVLQALNYGSYYSLIELLVV